MRRSSDIGKRKGMLYEALERLDRLMAIGEKRGRAKKEARARGEPTFAFTDQRIHSYQTRATYQSVIMRFLKWCRARFGLRRLSDIDICAEELACTYLEEHVALHYSAWTLQTERSALRLFPAFKRPLEHFTSNESQEHTKP